MKQLTKLTATLILLVLTVSLHAAVLDNFEDGDNGNWWGGYWYTYDDSKEQGGGSTVYPLPDAKGGIGFIPSDVTDQQNNFYAGRMWGELGGTFQYRYVGMGTNLAQNGDLPAPANISNYTGVRFKAKGSGTYQFKLVDSNVPNRNFKCYLTTFTVSSSWQIFTVNFNEASLAYGWGNYNNKTNPGDTTNWGDKPPLSTVLQNCEAFQWQTVEQTAGTRVDLWIDDVELIGGGSSFPTKPTSTQTGLIDDLDDGDAQNALGGYWYTFDDSERNGNTTVNPPKGTDYTPTSGGAGGSAYCASFSWTISQTPSYSEPFGALGTNLTPDGPPSVADATNTQGIRITYKSDTHHILKITVNDPTISSDPNGCPYQVGLPPSNDWRTVTFSWDEFVLPAWFMQENQKAGVDAMNNLKLSTRLNKVMQIHFQSAPVRYKRGGRGTFYVDNVMTVGGSIAGSGGGGGGGGGTTYTLTVNVSPQGAGTVTKNPDRTSYTAGTQVTLTATPAAGYAFVNWTEGTTVLGTAATLSITMNSNRTITANFQQIQAGQYTLTVLINPAGAGNVTKNPNQPSYTAGTQVTLTATPAAGYAFVNWTEGTTVLGSSRTISVTMNSNKIITANFQATGGGGGTGGGGVVTGRLMISDNPFKPGQQTTFRNLKSGEKVIIYNLLGIEVATLNESNGQASWDGKDKNGKLLDSGVYIYKGDKSGTTGKLIIVR